MHMDAKITKKRLGLLLSYDWLKILGICVAAVLLWSLLFTTMATRATNGQRFEMYLYPGVRFANSVDVTSLHERDKNDVLSYDVLDVSSVSLESNTMSTIMAAHFAAGQGDVLFAADIEPTRDENNNITAYNGLDSFIGSYYGNAVWLGADGQPWESPNGDKKPNYFADCEAYLNRFYNGDWKNGEPDEDAMRANFDERTEGDKRYKNDAQRAIGREQEVARIQNLRNAYAKVNEWLTSGSADSPISIKTTELLVDLNEDGEPETVEWQYAFDLSNIDNLTEFISYQTEDGTGTKEGLCMVILNTGSSGEEDLRYEPITFLEYLVKTYAPNKY